MYKRCVTFFLILITCQAVYAQNAKIDSLKKLLQQAKSDTQRIQVLNELCRSFWRIAPDTAQKLGYQALRIATKIGLKSGIANAENRVGTAYHFGGNHKHAILHYQKALAIFRAMNDSLGMSKIYNNLGIINKVRGDFLAALGYHQKSMVIQEKMGNRKLVSSSSNNMGNIYLELKNYPKALEYLKKSAEIKRSIKNYAGLVSTYTNMGKAYTRLKDYKQAMVYYRKALVIGKEHQHYQLIALTYHHMGDLMYMRHKVDSAIYYQKRALELSTQAKYQYAQNMVLNSLALAYYTKKNYLTAIQVGKEAFVAGRQSKELIVVKDASETLYKSYSALQQYKEAFHYQNIFVRVSDSLFNESRTKEVTRLEMNYDFQKKQELIQVKQQAKDARLKVENERRLAQQRLYLFSVLGVLFTVLVVSVFIFRSRQVQKKLNSQLTTQKNDLQQKKNELVMLNEELHQSRDEIIAQRDYIETQHKDLRQNKERIDSSIRAAQTIQHAVLPVARELRQIFADYFVIDRPKDVVSGDFYWVKQLSGQTIVVVADCTGHGVPGAFMSLIGVNLLDKIIFQENIIQPAEILNQLHFLMNIALRQQGAEQRSGGMDAVVFSLTPQTNHHTKVMFSGARNPLYYKDANQPDIQLLKGNRKSVGGIRNDIEQFILQEVVLPRGSVLYAGSDGLQDQNDAARKKFGSRRLHDLLQAIVSQPLATQKQRIETTLDLHMQYTVQRDDILWVGVKV
ncbi:tetratricopeptide repeat protein [Microscilla marina]|uniref:Tetratricopeptide repeat domain protein n=1 Tax=Microscilla marina ATCC 23134 TaxID=313606 RepID=A1ZXA2_MICM2|nr:tetratricopeptide repeat protein [Microscilla marina]EAY24976.1 tetratricopeptide repeat domain protein [Microscilla marina ATCC 23134]